MKSLEELNKDVKRLRRAICNCNLPSLTQEEIDAETFSRPTLVYNEDDSALLVCDELGCTAVGGSSGGGGDVLITSLDSFPNGGTTDPVEVADLDVFVPAGHAAKLSYDLYFVSPGGSTFSMEAYAKSGTVGASLVAQLFSTDPTSIAFFTGVVAGSIISQDGARALFYNVTVTAETDMTLGFRFTTDAPGQVLNLIQAVLTGHIIAPTP